MTKILADNLHTPLSVMFFVGLDKNSGPPILPWVLFKGEPPVITDEEEYFHPSPGHLIRTEADLAELRRRIARGVSLDKPYISLFPDPALIRTDFVHKVATLAVRYNMPVQLEGSILSHAYYILTREGAQVRCRRPSPRAGRRFFYKLVRDRIPDRIEAGGEKTSVSQAPPQEITTLLKKKIIEESFELFWENNPGKSLEEMADVLEVLQALCRASGYTLEQLQDAASRKRAERGGFEGGTILMETRDAGSEIVEFPFGAPIIGSEASVQNPKARIRRISEDEIIIPLIPESRRLGDVILPLGDDVNELVVKYSRSHVRIIVRPRRPLEPSNQLLLGLSFPEQSASERQLDFS
jgi:predicted house-cleaning noncanonical NTP pyrophosphatase (MazG superfamily)